MAIVGCPTCQLKPATLRWLASIFKSTIDGELPDDYWTGALVALSIQTGITMTAIAEAVSKELATDG